MKGFPKNIATKRDLENLLAMPEYKEEAMKYLQRLSAIEDRKAVRVISGSEETKDLITEEIDNPMPVWKQKGFKSREDIGLIEVQVEQLTK